MNINFFGLVCGIVLLKILYIKFRMLFVIGLEIWCWEVFWYEVKLFVNNYWECFLDYIGVKFFGFKFMV